LTKKWSVFEGHEAGGEVAPEHLRHALLERFDGWAVEHGFALAPERNVHPGVREGEARDRGRDAARLGLGRAQEFFAGRGVEEEVSHLDLGARPGSRRADGRLGASFEDGLDALVRSPGRREEPHARDRGYGGKRLAAEAERADFLQILRRGNLARRVALEGERGVLASYAAAVVAHRDEPRAAPLDAHVDAPRPGVEGVFEKLLDDRGRPLHDLARGNLPHESLGKFLDARQRLLVRYRKVIPKEASV
jgi:hypothetical protein